MLSCTQVIIMVRGVRIHIIYNAYDQKLPNFPQIPYRTRANETYIYKLGQSEPVLNKNLIISFFLTLITETLRILTAVGIK